MSQGTSSPSPHDDEDVPDDARGTRRGQRGRVVVVAVLLVVTAFVVGRLTGAGTGDEEAGEARAGRPGSAYAPRPEVVAEYNGSFEGFSDDAIANLAENAGIMVINKHNHNGRTELSAKDVNSLSEAAEDTSRSSRGAESTQILGYFMTQFWIQRFERGFQPWAASFDDSWLMRGTDGEPIPFWGVGGRPGSSETPLGYMVDLTNLDYQRWVVRSLTAWFKSARYSGIALDETNALSGSSVRRVLDDGQKSYNDLFCGATAPVDEDGNCERVAEYNEAQEALVQKIAASIHRAGGVVNYNGIAPSDARGPSRNLGILERTDVDSALNEAFCYEASARDKETDEADFNSVRDDAQVMRDQAAAGKSVIQVTNYQNDAKNERYAGYCGAAFMVGWQPGHAWYVYHQNYLQDLGRGYPFLPELTLRLGDPVEEADLGAATLTREFEHGWVVVNDDEASTTVTAPYDLVEFRDGEKGDSFDAGDTIDIKERDGRFFLKKDFVDSDYKDVTAG